MAAAENANPFFINGRISEDLVIMGAKPNTPNSIPHNGDKRARKLIEIISLSFLGAAENPATNPPNIDVHNVQIYCSTVNPGTT